MGKQINKYGDFRQQQMPGRKQMCYNTTESGVFGKFLLSDP
jgi:hypothetical protein